MFNDSQKFKQALFFLLFLQLSLWTIMSLAGCGGSENIPSASILTSGEVTLTWENAPGAAAYNIYLSTSPGVTVLNSYKISNATNPITITDMEPGTTYYFVVTVEDDSGQSRKSKEISYTVVNTQGSIQLGDILSHSEPDAAVSEFENVPEASLSDSKPEPPRRQVASTQSSTEIIICFGDSLTFGTGAGKGMDYPSQLAKMTRKPVINRGMPGDTTASALRRLKRDVLSKNPDIVLITLGGNDLKNGVSKDIAFGNLKQIVQAIQKQGAEVIIGGLRFPGKDRGFGNGYENLAQQTGAMLIPNIFAGIVGNPNLMSDPIHPNNSGYRIIARRFYNAIASSESKTKPKVKAATKTRGYTLAWDDVPNATSYNIYWSDKPGVTKKNGSKISNVKNPHKITGLKNGKKYYFVVTAVNASSESKESEEFSFTVGQ
jgi:lysophospholipase L1-like esterase